MSEPDPTPLLESRLEEYKRDLQKSISLYNEGKIDAETHLIHKTNLNKLITNYGEALELLKFPISHYIGFLPDNSQKITIVKEEDGKKT